MNPNPYKKNRVGFSIVRQNLRTPFSSGGTYINQMKKRNSERLERWAKEISLTSLTICLFTLTKQAQTFAIFDECWECFGVTSNHIIVVVTIVIPNGFTTKIGHCYLSIGQCKVALINYMYTKNTNNIISSASLTSLSTLVEKSQGLQWHQDKK